MKRTWRQLVIGALITGALYFISNIILVKWQTKSEKLTYYVTETQPFQGRIEKSVYNVVIANEGEKPLSDVKAFFNIPNGIIKERIVWAEPTLGYTDTSIWDSTYKLFIPSINTGDTVAVIIYAESDKSLPTVPMVSLRSKEINGVRGERARKTGTGLYQGMSVILAILSALAGYTLTLSFQIWRKRSLSATVKEKNKDNPI